MRRNIMGSLGGLALLTIVISGCGAVTSAQQEQQITIPTAPPAPTYAPIEAEAIPEAPSVENPNKAPVRYSNSFDSALSEWRVFDIWSNSTELSTWEVKQGVVEQVTGPDGYGSSTPTGLVTGDKTWADYSIRAQAYSFGNSIMGVVGRVNDAGFYAFVVRPEGAEGGKTVSLQRYDAATDSYTLLASSADKGWTNKTWATLELRFEGKSIIASIDGIEVLRAEDESYAAGQAGVYGYAEGNLAFDNLIIQ